jgi:beta-mannanase
MNNANNPYSADNMDGSSRGPAYSQQEFKQAWRRVVTILRGGPVSAIDAKLGSLQLPPVKGDPPSDAIAVSPIAFIWGPETAGTPNVLSESAASYWPGSSYVDWVGTDFYSQFPNFKDLDQFYKDYPNKPFVFAEWAMWNTDSAAFVQQFFSFINTHKRVKMILYNEGYSASSPLLLSKYPSAAAEIRKQVEPSRYLAYTPPPQPAS